jgi:hypothetical protein
MTFPGMKQADHGERIVYIRIVPASELPPEAQARTGGADVYAIHDENGARLALVADRDVAFVVARQNDLTPVSVH